MRLPHDTRHDLAFHTAFNSDHYDFQESLELPRFCSYSGHTKRSRGIIRY